MTTATCPEGCTHFRYTGFLRTTTPTVEGLHVCRHGEENWLPSRAVPYKPRPHRKWAVEIERTLATTVYVEAVDRAAAEAAAKALYGTDIESSDLEEDDDSPMFNAIGPIEAWPDDNPNGYWDGTDWVFD